ncbi:MAG: hypothetical protein ACTHME_05065 [Candidatus Nitrosocosmicus sp.]
MNWSDIASTVGKYAPIVATSLSSPMGAAIGAGTLIANLFGVDETPESVMDYIKNNPDKAQEKLNILQMVQEQNRHEEAMADMSLQSILGAQKNSVNVNSSPVDNKIKMLLVICDIIAFFICVIAMIASMFYGKPIDAGILGIIGMIVGYLIKSFGEKDGFYWGTSFGSQKKDDIIANKK